MIWQADAWVTIDQDGKLLRVRAALMGAPARTKGKAFGVEVRLASGRHTLARPDGAEPLSERGRRLLAC